VPSSMLIRYQTSQESFQTWDECRFVVNASL
jgi:hypothetical protein